MTTPKTIPVKLKWNKQTFDLNIEIGEDASRFKERVQGMTGVPIERQKLLAASKKGWKGPLPSDTNLDLIMFKDPSATLNVTLIGSAEVLAKKPSNSTIKFIEDMSPDDILAEEHAQEQAAMGAAEGMIQVLQLPPHKRDDKKQETYQYNRLVSGLPQRQIEQELKYGQKQQEPAPKEETDHNRNKNIGETSDATTDGFVSIQGKVAMQLGLEIRRAYINDLAVLEDGTCVSVLDEGHVQLWKNAAQQQDVIHQGIVVREGGVDSVVALNSQNGNTNQAAFATAGRGCIQLWTIDADPILALPGAMPGTTPASLQSVFGGTTASSTRRSGSSNSSDATKDTSANDYDDKTTICLAARFEITRQSDPSQFRLPPQNEAERQRRAQAEAQERAVQEALAKASRSIQVWFSSMAPKDANNNNNDDGDASQQGPNLSTQILEPLIGGLEGTAPITCLATISLSGSTRLLVAGDTSGGIRLWKAQHNDQNVQFSHLGLLQLIAVSTGDGTAASSSSCSIVCIEPLSGGRLAVSTGFGASNTSHNPHVLAGATPISIPALRAVHIIDLSELITTETSTITMEMMIPSRILTTLTGHSKDAVICMCELPDGALLTGGGKLDATLRMWSKSQIDSNQEQPKKSHPEEEDEAITQISADDNVQSKPIKTLTGDLGYVFALKVLPDAKDGSNYYAIAAARYNTIKVII